MGTLYTDTDQEEEFEIPGDASKELGPNAKTMGYENILGKKCKITVLKDEDGSVIKMWTWDKFLLRQEVINPKMKEKMTIIVTKFDLNSSVSFSKFEIPSSYKKSEMNLGNLFKNINKANNKEMEKDEKEVEMEKDVEDEQSSADDDENLNGALKKLNSLFGD